MRLAEIKNGVVVNVIEVDPATTPDWAAGWPEAGQAGPGWTYDGEVFSPPPPPTPEDTRAAMPPITRRQLRLTLVRNGISLADVSTAIAAIPDDLTRAEAEIEWEDASTYERLHPTLLTIADALALSPEHVDAMWQQALEA